MVDHKTYPAASNDRAVLEPDSRAKVTPGGGETAITDYSQLNSASDDSKVTRENPALDPFEELLEAVSAKYGISTMEDLLLLAPAYVPGFSLRERNWGKVLFDNLAPIEPRMEPFDKLQIDKLTKSLVLSLVQGHENSKNDADGFDDIISGKGKGLVIFLNGFVDTDPWHCDLYEG